MIKIKIPNFKSKIPPPKADPPQAEKQEVDFIIYNTMSPFEQKLTGDVTHEQSVSLVDVNERLRELAKTGNPKDPDHVARLLKEVENYAGLVKPESLEAVSVNVRDFIEGENIEIFNVVPLEKGFVYHIRNGENDILMDDLGNVLTEDYANFYNLISIPDGYAVSVCDESRNNLKPGVYMKNGHEYAVPEVVDRVDVANSNGHFIIYGRDNSDKLHIWVDEKRIDWVSKYKVSKFGGINLIDGKLYVVAIMAGCQSVVSEGGLIYNAPGDSIILGFARNENDLAVILQRKSNAQNGVEINSKMVDWTLKLKMIKKILFWNNKLVAVSFEGSGEEHLWVDGKEILPGNFGRLVEYGLTQVVGERLIYCVMNREGNHVVMNDKGEVCSRNSGIKEITSIKPISNTQCAVYGFNGTTVIKEIINV